MTTATAPQPSVATRFDDAPQSRESLAAAAIAATERSTGRPWGGSRDPYDHHTDGAVVNYLRHEFTSYDRGGCDPADRVEALVRIAARYPWLRAEVNHQIRCGGRRRGDDRQLVAA